MSLLLLACSFLASTLPGETASEETAPGDTGEPLTEDTPGGDTAPGADTCADAPVVTWANFGEGFLVGNCGACHAAASGDRHGAPADVVFDTEPDVARQVTAILAVATGESPTMPPAGGVEDEDRYLLEVWLTCFPPA